MKHISEIMTAVCKEHGITMNQGKPMSDLPNDKEGIVIAINNREKEINGTLDEEAISLISHELNVLYARLKQLRDTMAPTFGDKNDPLI